MATGSTAIDDRLADRELERIGGAAADGGAKRVPSARWRSPRSGRHWSTPTLTGRVVEQLRLAIDDVVSDGIDVEVAFVGPAVSVGENHLGLVDRDIGPTPAGTAWFG